MKPNFAKLIGGAGVTMLGLASYMMLAARNSIVSKSPEPLAEKAALPKEPVKLVLQINGEIPPAIKAAEAEGQQEVEIEKLNEYAENTIKEGAKFAYINGGYSNEITSLAADIKWKKRAAIFTVGVADFITKNASIKELLPEQRKSVKDFLDYSGGMRSDVNKYADDEVTTALFNRLRERGIEIVSSCVPEKAISAQELFSAGLKIAGEYRLRFSKTVSSLPAAQLQPLQR